MVERQEEIEPDESVNPDLLDLPEIRKQAAIMKLAWKSWRVDKAHFQGHKHTRSERHIMQPHVAVSAESLVAGNGQALKKGTDRRGQRETLPQLSDGQPAPEALAS